MTGRILQAREEVGDVVCDVAEGPIWDDRLDVLRWVDLARGIVHGHSPTAGDLAAVKVGAYAGFIVPMGSEDLLAGLPDGFATVGRDGTVTLERELERDMPRTRLNDGKADPSGRVWAGTMDKRDPKPDGTLYRLGADWSVTPVLRGVAIPNGIGWSPDAATMYFTDTTWSRIDAFAYDLPTGEISGQRTLVEIPREAGLPDGLTVDEDGCVWVALWGGGAVHRYTPDGQLDAIVRTPAPQTTSCVFGGSDRRDLFITSARIGLSPEQQADHPRSGRVFVCRPGVAGLPTDAFRPTAPPRRTS